MSGILFPWEVLPLVFGVVNCSANGLPCCFVRKYSLVFGRSQLESTSALRYQLEF